MSLGGELNDSSATETLLMHRNRGSGRFGLDIPKSIVYGGLLECIRSLSVISSAACSGSSTLSVLGLGVAMMVSDLMIFAKNLSNLKKGTDINPEKADDPYEELLGSRQNFGLHSTMSIFSFCLFGLIPPLCYFFLFSETDDKTLKLISAFMASLLCIILLALLEVCARNRPESFLDTVLNYANLAIKSSAIYHLVRNLVPDLLKNEDIEQPQSKPDVPVQPPKKMLTEHTQQPQSKPDVPVPVQPTRKISTECGTTDVDTESSTHRGRRKNRKPKKRRAPPRIRPVQHEESDDQYEVVDSSSTGISKIADGNVPNFDSSVYREDDSTKIDDESGGESSYSVQAISGGEMEVDVEKMLAEQETHDLFCPICRSCITKRVFLGRKTHLSSQEETWRISGQDSGEPEADRMKGCDVEKVLAIQETHDLYCPNCHSCITKEVIICWKQRRAASDLTGSNLPKRDAPKEAYMVEAEPERDVFRCLSCFSFFIPTGNAFKSFGDGRKEETSNDIPEVYVEIGTEPVPVQDQQVEIVVSVQSSLDAETGIELIPVPNQQLEGIFVEIIKSVVFGGLAECITSLGVVSCAAGSGASTRNIMALGIANLLTGLTVIGYSLQELRKEDQLERIHKLLGKRQNFRLHAVVSILSLLLFGLIPPIFCVIFNDRKHELLSAFGASLFCILLLVVGKVWVQKPPKTYVKSVLFYGSIAVGLSGISFTIGYLIGESLKLIGWVQPNQAGLLSVL